MKKISVIILFASAFAVIAVNFDIRNEVEFKKCVPDGAKVEKLASGFGFTEGPTWVSWDGGFLVFSDIPANELKKWTRKEVVSTFRHPSQNANGNLFAKDRLFSCEHSGRRVAIQTKDKAVETLVELSVLSRVSLADLKPGTASGTRGSTLDQFDGKKFNSPNDVAVKSDGTVWFTDPDYGLGGNKKEMEGNLVFRFDPKTKQLTAVVKDFDKPNGIAFSNDEKKLYIADSGKPKH
ncbi:MAG: SMP-30/gluconolactonase/LRE family protein, partial [Verrucomicrobiota bacterium]